MDDTSFEPSPTQDLLLSPPLASPPPAPANPTPPATGITLAPVPPPTANPAPAAPSLEGAVPAPQNPYEPGHPEFESYRQSIKDIESGGGNYSAVNPKSGAMGAYQVMPANLASWSQQALGRQVSRDEFLSNPKIQDAIFEDQTKRNYQQHGNWDDTASIWFSGQPYKGPSDKNNDGNITVPDYISRMRAGMLGFGGHGTGGTGGSAPAGPGTTAFPTASAGPGGTTVVNNITQTPAKPEEQPWQKLGRSLMETGQRVGQPAAVKQASVGKLDLGPLPSSLGAQRKAKAGDIGS